MSAFIDLNGWRWAEKPAIDDAENLVVGIAAGGRTKVPSLRARLVAHGDPEELNGSSDFSGV